MKLSTVIYFMVLVFFVSCKQMRRELLVYEKNCNQIVLDSIYRVEKFDSLKSYPTLSLQYKGKSILKIGQKTTELDTTLSYRIDPNMDYQYFSNLITDYLSMDDRLYIELENYSSVNGIAFFSTDIKTKRIFNISASWYFDLRNENMEQAAIDSITKRIFPVLKNKIQLKKDWKYQIETKHQIEKFYVTEREINKGWNLDYEVILK